MRKLPLAPRSVNCPTMCVFVLHKSEPRLVMSTHTAATPGAVAASPVVPAQTLYQRTLEPFTGPSHWFEVTNTSHESGPTWTGELSNPSFGVAIGAQGENDGGDPPFGAGVGEGEAASVAVLLACSAGPVEAAVAPQGG